MAIIETAHSIADAKIMEFSLGDVSDSGSASTMTPTKESGSEIPALSEESTNPKVICPLWTKCTDSIHAAISTFVVQSALSAARNPKKCVGGISLMSVLLVAVGFFTNFSLELDFEKVFTPLNSLPANHKAWVFSEDGFPDEVRKIVLLLHDDGNNVLTMDAMERVFQGLGTIRETPGFDELCAQGVYLDFEGHQACRVMSATGYFEDHKVEAFREEIQTNIQLRNALSPFEFANGSPVFQDAILGNWIKDSSSNLTSAESFLVTVEIPDMDETNDFERKMLDRLDKLRRQWIQADTEAGISPLKMDVFTIYAYEVEYQRAIEGDLYLVVIVAIVMCSFVALVFYGYGQGQGKSRTLLGVAAVYTISMSFLSGCGLMFLVGVPFTTVTQILPFIVFGIGLDDTFIIAGAYFRTDTKLETIDRIRITMEEVAQSITLTTVTTVFAFLLGLMSSLPGVRWLCIYAFVTISIDFMFQITMFCAFITLDEQRLQDNRRDCCFWLKNKGNVKDNDDGMANSGEDESCDNSPSLSTRQDDSEESLANDEPNTHTRSTPERIMRVYADFLLRPCVKVTVLLMFGALFAGCAYSATLLTQEFKLGDFVPQDSYLKDTLYSLESYASVIRPIGVYFRNLDQMDPTVQDEMINYVNDLESLDQLSSSTGKVDMVGPNGEPVSDVKPFCWVRDFQQLQEQFATRPEYELLGNLTFSQQLDIALADPTIREVYGQDIVRDENGTITASRCWLFLANVGLNSIDEQLDTLHDQRAVGAAQPANQDAGIGNWSMFFFDDILFYWEAYDVALRELIFTIVTGVVAVTAIAFVLIPHWSAVCFVFPMIVMTYCNFLGTLQFFGIHIDGIFYICVVVSVGLLVDFLMHILLRYYETSHRMTRNERVKETLETMGASIMLGGFTTFLGVVPLCLSSTKIFMTVFLAFLGMVVLGVAHGLILLPVVLSLVGPSTGTSATHVALDEIGVAKKAPVKHQMSNVSNPATVASLHSSSSSECDSSLSGGGKVSEDIWV